MNTVIAKAVPVDHDKEEGKEQERGRSQTKQNMPFRRVKAEQYDTATFTQLDNRYRSLSNNRGRTICSIVVYNSLGLLFGEGGSIKLFIDKERVQNETTSSSKA